MTAIEAPAASLVQPDIPSSGRDPASVPALSIGGVSHSYGPRRALSDVNFTVAPASFTALVGLNRAGKGTPFSLITRRFGIHAGHVSLFGPVIIRSPRESLRL